MLETAKGKAYLSVLSFDSKNLADCQSEAGRYMHSTKILLTAPTRKISVIDGTETP